jgi:hypothetical protein
MEMLVRLEQLLKASFPISVTDWGMEMLVRLEQSQKAFFPISFSPSDITKEINCTFGKFLTINSGPSALVRLEQPKKAPSPISVTDGGMEMLVRLKQP